MHTSNGETDNPINCGYMEVVGSFYTTCHVTTCTRSVMRHTAGYKCRLQTCHGVAIRLLLSVCYSAVRFRSCLGEYNNKHHTYYWTCPRPRHTLSVTDHKMKWSGRSQMTEGSSGSKWSGSTNRKIFHSLYKNTYLYVSFSCK